MVNFADVEEPHRLPFLLDSLDVQIQFKGPDVLGGFAEIASSGKDLLYRIILRLESTKTYENPVELGYFLYVYTG